MNELYITLTVDMFNRKIENKI